uniref:DNA gyrase subunit A n=1 Tax=Caenorhabditis tropicalis TaxID=1561998 RepID=A0A1I7UPR9_9PELO
METTVDIRNLTSESCFPELCGHGHIKNSVKRFNMKPPTVQRTLTNSPKCVSTFRRVINRRIAYTISDKSEASVFVDAKGSLEVLHGSVNESADDSFNTTSKAFFKKPEWCIGLIKGVNNEIPLVAVHGVHNKKFVSLTAMDQKGIRQVTPMLSYEGHVGEVNCMTVTPELILTGGEDGKVVVQVANFKNAKFGDDGIDRLTLDRNEDSGPDPSSKPSIS